eukprot:4830687-Amphidinium_carterae.3
MEEDGHTYEVMRATVWNCLPCISESQLCSLVEALTTWILRRRVWTKSDWEKSLGLTLHPIDKEPSSEIPLSVDGKPSSNFAEAEATKPAAGNTPIRSDAALTLAQASDFEKVVWAHKLPKQPTLTNAVTQNQIPRFGLFGVCGASHLRLGRGSSPLRSPSMIDKRTCVVITSTFTTVGIGFKGLQHHAVEL